MSAKYADLGRAAARHPRRRYDFVPPPELGRTTVTRVPVVIVGGGPIGLAMAVDLSSRGVRSVVLEKHDTVSDGSRAICWAKRTLEILDRLGVARPMIEKGVVWNVGKVFVGGSDEPVYTFDLLPDKQQQFPAFINLQQYYPEEYLVERIDADAGTEIRWKNEVTAVEPGPDGVRVTVSTPAGDYRLECDYLVAADGCRSPVRTMLGLDFDGRVFEDRFLIADIRMKADFPAERRFWFDPPFNPGKTSLMHKQADDVWRLDFQLGRTDVDRDEALRDEHVDRMVRAFLGPGIDYEYEWVSLYTFQCRRMKRFVHGRVIFAGDAAHLVSPFGARGANGGIQDVDNLAWKLALVLEGAADERLLESYDAERVRAADENLLNSTRSTDFLTPRNAASRACRDAVLKLAGSMSFARAFVNSGRLSVPCVLDGLPLSTPDADEFDPRMRPGAPCIDAPVTVDGADGWFLPQTAGTFCVLAFSEAGERTEHLDVDLAPPGIALRRLVVSARPAAGCIHDSTGLLARHYDASPGTVYLLRPDQHVAARWRHFNPDRVRAAIRRAMAVETVQPAAADPVRAARPQETAR